MAHPLTPAETRLLLETIDNRIASLARWLQVYPTPAHAAYVENGRKRNNYQKHHRTHARLVRLRAKLAPGSPTS